MALLLDFPARPDIALVDLVLPGMGGMAYAEQLEHVFPAVRIILMTGFIDAADIAAAEARGPLLLKPFVPDTLFAIIEAAA